MLALERERHFRFGDVLRANPGTRQGPGTFRERSGSRSGTILDPEIGSRGSQDWDFLKNSYRK